MQRVILPILPRRWLLALAASLLCCLSPSRLFASGKAFNALVVVNPNSPDSVELGDHYAAAHGIPPHHVCPVALPTNLVILSSNDFNSLLLAPVRNHIASNNLGPQIDFIVLCGDFPTRVRGPEGVSASLFYGFKKAPAYHEDPPGCKLEESASNAYFRAERAFRSADGWNGTNGFVAFHLIASNLAAAKLVADRGAAAQSSFPPSSFYLYNLGDGYRGIREQRFANAQFSFAALPGLKPACFVAPKFQTLWHKTNVVGHQDGYGNLTAGAASTSNVWLPGAFADHLTSCGGMIPDPCYGQSTVLQWMGVGATASHGTVAEPCNYLEKFPDPLMAFFYARGFTVGESYLMSVEYPYQSLFAGDPLAAPFAAAPLLSVPSHSPFQIVSGAIPFQVSAQAHPDGAPAAAIDLFVDGRFSSLLASVSPEPANVLSIAVAGVTNSAVVASNASLFDAVAALADAVEANSNQIVRARAFADRLHLTYKLYDHAADFAPVAASVAPGAASNLSFAVGPASPHLVPSIYPARKFAWLAAHSSAGANSNDLVRCVVTLLDEMSSTTNEIVAAQGESTASLVDRLAAAINSDPLLMQTNGLFFDRISQFSVPFGHFFARTPGPAGAAILVDFSILPVATNSGLATNVAFLSLLSDNPQDVLPRASVLFRLSPPGGILSAESTFLSTNLPDGVHLFDFVARDGSAVAAASRLSLPLAVANTSLVFSASSPHGSTDPPPGLRFLSPGAVVTNSVDPPAPANGTQLVCAGWSFLGNEPSSGSSNLFETALTNHASLEWLWSTNLWLDASAGPDGSVDASPSWRPAGSTASVLALPDPYFQFDHWSGDASGSANPLLLPMVSPKTVSAHFAPILAANDTPHWWLAQFGWTNNFDSAALDDPDADGFFTWQEFLADTDPTDPGSFLLPLSSAGTATNLVFAVEPTSTARHYHVDSATNLADSPSWTSVTNAPGTGSPWLPEIAPPSPGPLFYRGRVTLPPP